MVVGARRREPERDERDEHAASDHGTSRAHRAHRAAAECSASSNVAAHGRQTDEGRDGEERASQNAASTPMLGIDTGPTRCSEHVSFGGPPLVGAKSLVQSTPTTSLFSVAFKNSNTSDQCPV